MERGNRSRAGVTRRRVRIGLHLRDAEQADGNHEQRDERFDKAEPARAVSAILNRCVHVQVADDPDSICETWDEYVSDPLREQGKPVPQLRVIKSPYRTILTPIVDYIHEVERETEHRKICVLVPEMMVKHWWEGLMHNHRAGLLKVLLLVNGNPRTFVINVPWYLEMHSK